MTGESPEGQVFFALADGTRRRLLDRLHARDGQRLSELSAHFTMSRQAVSRHLEVLAGAGLVVAKQEEGRRTRHFLDAGPLLEVQAGWLGKFTGG